MPNEKENPEMPKQDEEKDTPEKEAGNEETEDVALQKGEWSKKPNSDIRRIFRICNPPSTVSYVTYHRVGGQLNGTTIPEKTMLIQANSIGQVILVRGAEFYSEQLKVLRRFEVKKVMQEINPEAEGTPYIPPEQLRVQAAKEALKKAEREAEKVIAY